MIRYCCHNAFPIFGRIYFKSNLVTLFSLSTQQSVWMTAIQNILGRISPILHTQVCNPVLWASNLLFTSGSLKRKIFCAQSVYCYLQICQLYLFYKQFKARCELNWWKDFTTNYQHCKKHTALMHSSSPLTPSAHSESTIGIHSCPLPTRGPLALLLRHT